MPNSEKTKTPGENSMIPTIYQGKKYKSQREVAKILGVSDSTVHRHLTTYGNLDRLTPNHGKPTDGIESIKGRMNSYTPTEIVARRVEYIKKRRAEGAKSGQIAEELGVVTHTIYTAMRRSKK